MDDEFASANHRDSNPRSVVRVCRTIVERKEVTEKVNFGQIGRSKIAVRRHRECSPRRTSLNWKVLSVRARKDEEDRSGSNKEK